MKTQVGTTQEKGRIRAELLPISGEIMVMTISPMHDMAGAALDAHSAYVLGYALVRMAEKLDAEHGQPPAAHRFASFGDQKNRRCIECNVVEGGVRCHGDACAAGQLPCPSPKACGVAA